MIKVEDNLEKEILHEALLKELAFLKKRMQKRNNEAALKWRRKAFYFKTRYERLKERWENEIRSGRKKEVEWGE